MIVFTVIPFFSNGVDIDLNDVKVFTTYDGAEEYVRENRFPYYEIVETTLVS